MKRFIVILGLLVVLILGGVTIAPSFVDWNKHKDKILSQLHEATGHDYKIDGPLAMAVLPFPHLSVSGLSVSTPTTSGDLPQITMDRASIQLALMPLFKGNIVVSKVLLEKPVFNLAVDAKGNQSWMTKALKAKMDGSKPAAGGEQGAGLGEAVALNEIQIKDGSFTYADYGSGQKIDLKNINMTLHGDSLYGPYSLDGDLVYDGHKAKIKLTSGRVDSSAESIAIQLGLDLPDLGASVSYAGVVAYKDKVELQGETGVKTPDIAALMTAFTKKEAPAYLSKKGIDAKGVLTFDANELAYRNMKATFAGVDATGYAVVKNYAKDAKGPLDVSLVLETTKPYDLQALIPPPSGDKKAQGGKQLLPQTVTLPKPVTLSVNIKSAAVQYGGTTYKDVALSVDRSDKGFTGQVNLKAPGNTTVDINSKIDFGSQSKSAQDGSVTLSDPVLALETKVQGDNAADLAQAFSKTPLAEGAKNLLNHSFASEAKLSVKPDMVNITSSYVKLLETRVNASGAYILGKTGPDLLKLDMSNFGLDADKWMKIVAGQSTPNMQPEKPDIAAFTKNIALPFDLNFSASLQSLHLKGRDYSKLETKGTLAGSKLTLQTLQLTSNGGDVFTLAGGVRDVTTLGGIDLSLQAAIVDLEDTLQSFGFDPAKLPTKVGKADFLAEFKGEPNKLDFTANLNALRGLMQASGTVANVLKTPIVSDLTLRVQHPSYVEVARLFNPKFNSGVGIKKNLDIFASMNRKDDVYSFSQLQAIIGPTTIKGDVKADVSGAKPAITAALEVTDMPVDKLLGIRTGNSSSTVSATPLTKTQDVRWSRNAIDTKMLHLADIALKATAGSISYGNWDFQNAGINLDLKDGNLDIKQMDGGFAGGHVAITGMLKTSDKDRQPLDFQGDILAQDVDMAQFVSSFSGSQLIKASGTVTLQTNLQTTGLSPAALVFDLGGKGTAKGTDLVFQGFDLARLSRALAEPSKSFTDNFTRLMDASLGGGSTSFKTLDGAFTINEGVIKFDKMDLLGDAADVGTTGTVSLPLWTLDLTSTVQLHDPKDAPPLRASFKGPIDKPAQTFGQNAMQQYFQKQIGGQVLNPVLDKIDNSGTLKKLLGTDTGTPAPAPAPQQTAPATPDQSQQVAPTTQQPAQQQAPAQQTQQKKVTPEDALFGVIQGVLGGQ